MCTHLCLRVSRQLFCSHSLSTLHWLYLRVNLSLIFLLYHLVLVRMCLQGTRPSRGYVAQGRSASMSDEPSSMIGRSSDRANPGSGSQKRKGRSNSSSSRPPAAPASSHHSRAAPQAANKHRRHPRTPPTTSTSSNGAGGGAVRGSRVSSSSSSAGTAAGEQKRRRLAASAAAHAWQDAAESGGSSSSTRTSRSSRSGEEEDDDAISGEEENNVTSGRGGGSRLHSSEWGDNASGGYGAPAECFYLFLLGMRSSTFLGLYEQFITRICERFLVCCIVS